MRMHVFTGVEEFVPEIHISDKFMEIVRALDKKIDTEFSVLGKATINGNKYEVGDEYYIPKQTVEYASVDYEEDMYKLREEGWNVVVHKHPSGVKEFSSADYEYLNNQFDLSLLWVDNKFNDATVRIMVRDMYLVIDVEKENVHIGTESNIDITGIDNITVKKYNWRKTKTLTDTHIPYKLGKSIESNGDDLTELLDLYESTLGKGGL